MALIFGLSSIAEVPTLPGPKVLTDKELHTLLYFGFGLLLSRGLSKGFGSRVTLMTAILVTVLAALYGVSDEFHQSFVPPRQVDAFDVVADTVGGALAGFGLYAWGIIRFRHGL
jgi:VanZ family protein